MSFQHASLLLALLIPLSGSPTPTVMPVSAASSQQQRDPIEPVLVPPNVVVILVDDLGLDQLLVYHDVNRYTCPYPYAYTPNIDYLASIGVRFRQARVTPLCSPTRAALQSGRYGRRTGCGTLVTEPNATASFCELNGSAATPYTMLGDVLDPFGYTSAMFGKLHLQLEMCDTCPGGGNGTGDSYALGVLGFDRFQGSPRNLNTNPDVGVHPCDPNNLWREHAFTHYYFSTALPGQLPVRELVCGCPGGCPSTTNQCIELTCPGDPNNCAVPCTYTDCYDGEYATRKQRLAVDGWVQGANEPFLALWCPNDIHGPLEWPPADTGTPGVEGHFQGSTAPPVNHGNRRLRAKLEHLDASIGELLQSIDLDRTVVMLLGDNGTQGGPAQNVQPTEEAYPAPPTIHPYYPFDPSPCVPPIGGPVYTMDPYQASHLKGSAYDGGVRVPLIVAGKGVVGGSPGSPRVSDALVDVVDIQETLRELAQGGNYVAPTTCTQVSSPGCTDSISFACVLRNSCTPAAHARQFSHASLYWPNSFPPAPHANPPAGEAAREYYLRRGATGRLWKIVRKYEAPGCYRDEFYEVVTDPLEVTNLGTSHPQYAATKAEFDARFPPFFNQCP